MEAPPVKMMRWNKRRSFTLARSPTHRCRCNYPPFLVFFLSFKISRREIHREKLLRDSYHHGMAEGCRWPWPVMSVEPEKRVKIQQYNYWKTKSLKCGGGGHLVCERNRRQIRGENCIQYGRSCHIYFTWPISHANSILLT